MPQQLGFDFSLPDPMEQPGQIRSSPQGLSAHKPTADSKPIKNARKASPKRPAKPQTAPGAPSSPNYDGLRAAVAEIFQDEAAIQLITEIARDRPLRELAFFAAEIPDVVEAAGISRSTLYERMDDGSLKYAQIAERKRVIPVWDLLDFLGRKSYQRRSV